MPDGAEDRLLVVPSDPADLEVVVAADAAGRSGRDPAVHQHQLEPAGDALLGQVLQHQLAGSILVGGGGHDKGADREAGHVDGDDALGALGAPVGAAPVVEGESAIRRAARQVGVDDDHRGRLIGPPIRLPRGRVQHRQGLRPCAVA